MQVDIDWHLVSDQTEGIAFKQPEYPYAVEEGKADVDTPAPVEEGDAAGSDAAAAANSTDEEGKAAGPDAANSTSMLQRTDASRDRLMETDDDALTAEELESADQDEDVTVQQPGSSASGAELTSRGAMKHRKTGSEDEQKGGQNTPIATFAAASDPEAVDDPDRKYDVTLNSKLRFALVMPSRNVLWEAARGVKRLVHHILVQNIRYALGVAWRSQELAQRMGAVKYALAIGSGGLQPARILTPENYPKFSAKKLPAKPQRVAFALKDLPQDWQAAIQAWRLSSDANLPVSAPSKGPIDALCVNPPPEMMLAKRKTPVPVLGGVKPVGETPKNQTVEPKGAEPVDSKKEEEAEEKIKKEEEAEEKIKKEEKSISTAAPEEAEEKLYDFNDGAFVYLNHVINTDLLLMARSIGIAAATEASHGVCTATPCPKRSVTALITAFVDKKRNWLDAKLLFGEWAEGDDVPGKLKRRMTADGDVFGSISDFVDLYWDFMKVGIDFSSRSRHLICNFYEVYVGVLVPSFLSVEFELFLPVFLFETSLLLFSTSTTSCVC